MAQYWYVNTIDSISVSFVNHLFMFTVWNLKAERKQREIEREIYYVPTTLLVFASIWSSPNILAIPKSDIFGFIDASSKTLLAFKSLWIIFSLES